jgi:hypothetical protein
MMIHLDINRVNFKERSYYETAEEQDHVICDVQCIFPSYSRKLMIGHIQNLVQLSATRTPAP